MQTETHIDLMKRLIDENDKSLAQAQPVLCELEGKRAESQKRHGNHGSSAPDAQSVRTTSQD